MMLSLCIIIIIVLFGVSLLIIVASALPILYLGFFSSNIISSASLYDSFSCS